jgi:large subunit ribosomal protein L17
MRHQKAGRKFSRPSSHRNAMFSNMLASLVMHERIFTTVPKAKELRRIADRTISWGASVTDITAKPQDKRSTDERARLVHAIRMARRVLRSEEALEKLFGDVAARFIGRPGGYTRVLKSNFRKGDAAPMALIELVVMRAPEAEAAEPAPAADEGKGKKAKAPKAKAEKAEASAEKPAKAAKAKAPKAEKADKAEGQEPSDCTAKPTYLRREISRPRGGFCPGVRVFGERSCARRRSFGR